MKKGAQKAKGSSYERVIAKLFTKQYYPNGDGEFKRVPLSGGWDKRVAPGDLMALKHTVADCIGQCLEEQSMVIDRSFPFSIECKNYRDENVKHFFSGLYSNQSQMFDWLRQAELDASLSKKLPLVIFKLYGTSNIVMTNYDSFHACGMIFGQFTGDYFRLTLTDNRGVYKLNATFFLLSDMFEWIDWEYYKE